MRPQEIQEPSRSFRILFFLSIEKVKTKPKNMLFLIVCLKTFYLTIFGNKMISFIKPQKLTQRTCLQDHK